MRPEEYKILNAVKKLTMELSNWPKDEGEPLSPKGTASKGETSELNEASPPTKCNTKYNHP